MARIAWPAAVLLVGCSLPEQPTRKPTLPTAESVTYDVSFFATHVPDNSAPSVNWASALERIAFLDSNVVQFLVVPDTVLRAAVADTPSQAGGNWRWEYATTIAGEPYSGYFHGFGQGTNDVWSLIVNAPTLTPSISNHLWMEGVSTQAADAGIWIIYQPAFTGPAETVRLDWGMTATIRELVLERVASTLRYRIGAASGLITYVSSATEPFELTWNPQTGTGSLALGTAPLVCWDAQQHDVTCP